MSDNKQDFKNTPRDQHRYWKTELTASKKRLRKFHKTGDKVVEVFLGNKTSDTSTHFQLNMFHSNITTISSMLYGNLPKVDVSRRYADANDDVSRVAATTMERLLNLDIEDHGDDYNSIFESLMQDRLLPGLAVARVRYEVEIAKDEEGNACIASESAPIDYFHWRDVLWGWGRSFKDLPWVAFRSFLSKEEVEKRFGKKVAKTISMKRQMIETDETDQRDDDTRSPWDKAEIWEIWDKQKKQVVWYAEGYDKILDTKKDPLCLRNFFPCPQFFMANATTSLYVPKADYKLAEDLYQEIDILQSRIAIITEAVKVVGIYDKSADGVKRIFNEGEDNDLIPVDNWAMFAEKGGLAGQIDWLPIGEIVDALDKLIGIRDDTIQMLQQVTGMSDIMQGGLKNQYEGTGQSQMKAQFGSIRIQKLQESFANFVSGLMQLKAEIISRHFDPQTIAKQSNMQYSPDVQLLPDVIKLIKNTKEASLRVKVRSENLATTDFAQMQEERGNFINALSTYLQSSAPLIEQEPAAKPFLMRLMQWGLAGYRGSAEVEGIFDSAIAALEAQEKQGGDQKPDPEAQKMQMQQQLEQMKQSNEMQKLQAKTQSDIAIRKQDEESDIQTASATHQMKMAEIQASMVAKVTEEKVKLEAALLTEKAQAESSIMQTNAAAEAEIQKTEVEGKIDLLKEHQKTNNKIDEITASATAKIGEQEHAAQKTKETATHEPREGKQPETR